MTDPSRRPSQEVEGELRELALDLFWTWSHRGDALWRELAPAVWELTRNPWIILQEITHARLDELARDEGFLSDLRQLAAERRAYLDSPGWFATLPERDALGSVAFFCMEFGLSEALPLYAGGLGVLAGDVLKTASDLAVPMTGIGLLYQEGYFRQMLDAAGRQEEAYPYNEPASMPVTPTYDADGNWLRIPLALPGRTVLLRVWQAVVGRTRLYLLDSNDPLNTPSDRGITAKLYGGGPTIRFLQEVALGVGGWRLLEALGIEPAICHLNEGHAAFAALERVRTTMARHDLDFASAAWASRAGNVFTTHTPVDAGFDRFDPSLIEQYLLGEGGLYTDLGLTAEEMLALGRKNRRDAREPFTTAYLAMRLSARVSAVSRLHATVTSKLFAPLYPRWPEEEVPIGHVTNGVHMPSWDSAAADKLWTEVCGKERWRVAPDGACRDVTKASDEALWTMRAKQRTALVAAVRAEQIHQLRLRRPHSGTLPDIERVLDPNALTLGFGRRFTSYKRPDLLLSDPERLKRLLANPGTPCQLVIAGKAHPEDEAGKRSVARWAAFVAREDVRRHAVFLEDYDIRIAEKLVQGVDVWINTPRRPLEACGTSGMKVLVNGGLNLSSLDGWWAEAFTPEVGWAFGNSDRDDGSDAADLYRLLEQEIVPEFYSRDARGLPRRWIARMRASMSRLGSQFGSNRMLVDYVTNVYVPSAREVSERLADEGRLARKLADWERSLRSHWDQVWFGRLEAAATDHGWRFTVHVQLGEIAPDQVVVELVAEPLGEAPRMRHVMERGLPIPGTLNGFEYHLDIATTRPAEHFTPRIVPTHPHAAVPAELPLVRWQR